MAGRIQLRGGTAATGASENPVLGYREPGVEADTGRMKIGNGVDEWLDLPYVDEVGIDGAKSQYTRVVGVTGAGIDPTGVADSVTAINALIAANPGAVFDFEADGIGSTYKITTPIVMGVSGVLRLGSATISQVTSGQPGINVTASNVIIDRGIIQGAQFAGVASNERGLRITGTSAASPISYIKVVGTKISRFGQYGIYAEHVHKFVFDNVEVKDIWSHGIICMSCIDGVMWAPRVENIIGTQACGISLSRTETNSLTTEPHCTNITVQSPTVLDVPLWTGLDAHGGIACRFLDVDVRNCYLGVAIGATDNASNVETWGPRDCWVTGVIDSERTDGLAAYGVSFTGVSANNGTFPFNTLATGVIDVTVKNHGTASEFTSGGVYMRSTFGVNVRVRAEACSPAALALYYDNYQFTAEVSAVDTWGATGANTAVVINATSSYNYGTVLAEADRTSGNISPTYLNAAGIRTAALSTVNLRVVSQDSTATTPIVQGSGSVCRYLFPNGSAASPSVTFAGSPLTGFYQRTTDQIGVAINGSEEMIFLNNALLLTDGTNISTGTTTGSIIGTSASAKLGFWGATAVVRPTSTPAAATDLATALTLLNDIRSTLISIGLNA